MGPTGPQGPNPKSSASGASFGMTGAIGYHSAGVTGAIGPAGPTYQNRPMGLVGVTGATGPSGPSRVYWFLDPDEMREAVGNKPEKVLWSLEEYANRSLALKYVTPFDAWEQRIWITANELIECEDIPRMILQKYQGPSNKRPSPEMQRLLDRMATDLVRHGWTIWSVMVT